ADRAQPPTLALVVLAQQPQPLVGGLLRRQRLLALGGREEGLVLLADLLAQGSGGLVLLARAVLGDLGALGVLELLHRLDLGGHVPRHHVGRGHVQLFAALNRALRLGGAGRTLAELDLAPELLEPLDGPRVVGTLANQRPRAACEPAERFTGWTERQIDR